MRNINLKNLFFLLAVVYSIHTFAWIGSATPQLHVEGRNLKDPHGNTVILHGFAQTYSPWFNERGTKWTNYNVTGCLNYNKGLIDQMLTAGWKMNFVRLHMDPYWSNTPGVSTTGENDISAFSMDRFKTYLDQVFVPMAEYAISKGLYVIMRPPGVCPEKIAVGDAYNQYLIKVWSHVSQHPKLRNNPAVMFELANEPVNILAPDGTYGSRSQGCFDNLKKYFQAVVDTMRANGSQNILWVPGLAYQASYSGYAVNPIEGSNIGYAVHIYPGWFGSGTGYSNFQKGWDIDVKPVANFAPICVTEMDWAPAKYNSSWGKDVTGIAGGSGFGANFNKITKESGNVSWLLFTDPALLAKFTGIPPAAGDTAVFLNDPEACPWPIYNWYKEYALTNFPRPDFSYRSTADNGDGTYSNPVVFGDFPDPDVIRVGDVYYMSTTTMHHFPGATILKSYDLVNWEYCSNPLEKIESTDCYNLDGCNRYSHGQWASSLKYHKGKFYMHFNTLDEGSYLLTATDPAGKWTKIKLAKSFYDAGLFFDDDDKTYIVYGINNLHIAELDSNFNVVKDQAITLGTVQSGIVNTGTEGSHLYKKDGYYYIYATTGGFYATQVAYRSNSIFGTWDEKEVFNSNRVHQGALIQTQTGEWWTILFADKGAYGRLPMLEPVTWIDNWPMVGLNGKDVATHTKPNVGKVYPKTYLPTNDNFRDYKFAPQWEWNHNADNSKWSLVKRPGYLRLYTANITDSLTKAKNTITQRILGFPKNQHLSYGTVKMHLQNMKDGDVAGLAVFQDPYAYVGVKMSGIQKNIVFLNTGTKTQQTGAIVTDSIIYFRAIANYNTSKADFYYSTDNITYTTIGSLDMKYNLSVFVGNRFCIFNYATVNSGGYVDIDWFSTDKDFKEDTFFDNSFTGYSEDALTLSEIKTDKTSISLITGSSKSFTITAVYKDGHTEDVTLSAAYTNSNPTALTIKNGQLIAKANGESTVTVSYQGGMGATKSLTLTIKSTYFPLTAELFNPSIYGTGTFNASTSTLVTSQYGFGGWNYSSGADLSNYRYLVAKLNSVTTSGASFRAFDEGSYWTKPAMVDFGSNKQAVIDLWTATKNGTSTILNPSHLYIIGFWSNGGGGISLNDVYVTNNSDFSKPAATDPLIAVESNPTVGGSVKGSGIYSIGSACTLIASPVSGYSFSSWTENGTVVSTNATYTFTVSSSRQLKANYALSNNNYKVKAVNCSCQGSADGAINVTFAQALTYKVLITGDNYNATGTTTAAYSIDGLKAGTYNVNITSASIPGYELNFTIVINEPADLNVQKLNEETSTVIYSLKGGENYYISVNGEIVRTSASVVNVSLQKGENHIRISTDKTCQGIYNETINIGEDFILQALPNPTFGNFVITIPEKDEQVCVEIMSLSGSVMYKQTLGVATDRNVTIDASVLNAGVYMVRVLGNNTNASIKLIKK